MLLFYVLGNNNLDLVNPGSSYFSVLLPLTVMFILITDILTTITIIAHSAYITSHTYQNYISNNNITITLILVHIALVLTTRINTVSLKC